MKWTGAFIIISVCYAVGNIISKAESEKTKTVDSLLNLFAYMKRRISSERTPIFQIFSSFTDDFLEETGFLPAIRSHRFAPNKLWNGALDRLNISKEAKNELSLFGNELGILDLNEQLKRIDAVTEYLSSEKNSLKESLPKKQKSIKSFCLLSGILAAIILF